MFRVVENEPLAPRSLFRSGGLVRYFISCTTESDIPAMIAFAHEKQVSSRVLGEGSNILFGEGVLPYCFIKLTMHAIRLLQETKTDAHIAFDAGVPWDDAVAWTVAHVYAGIEALSGIPGTCGAAPVQNIGAYGQELKDTLTEMRAYDTIMCAFVSLPASACAFGYRTSIFNTTHKNRYIITGIVLKLSKLPHPIPDYQDVKKYFAHKNITDPSLVQIRSAILEIRASKLPDPNIYPNLGSFFKNPVIKKTHADILKESYPDIKLFPVSDVQTKVSAGWLIERCGFKGSSIGPIGIYEKNALVLMNLGNATSEDVMRVQDKIARTVREKFDIALEMEPEIMSGEDSRRTMDCLEITCEKSYQECSWARDEN